MKPIFKSLLLILIGILTGSINGFFGGGGGMIVVPLLIWINKFETKVAHATALAIILPVSVVSAITYIVGGGVDWIKCAFVTAGVIVGGIVGAKLLEKINVKWLPKIFALVMAFAGAKLLFF